LIFHNKKTLKGTPLGLNIKSIDFLLGAIMRFGKNFTFQLKIEIVFAFN
jgi:hypothetical protein